MLSKNNYPEKCRRIDKRQEHFSIRKLTIGTVSVLIGMSLYLGNNANLVKADTNTEPQQETEQTKDKSQDSSQAENHRAIVSNNSEAQKIDSKNATNSGKLLKSKPIAKSVPAVDKDSVQNPNQKQHDLTAEQKDENSDIQKQTLDLSAVKKGTPENKATGLKELSEEKAGGFSSYNYDDDHGKTVSDEANGIKLSVNKNVYNPGDTHSEIITLSVGGVAGHQTVRAGDKITIKIPLGNYQVHDYDSLDSKYGTTTSNKLFEKDASGEWYCTITDNFTKADQTITQNIYLKPYSPIDGKEAKRDKSKSQWFNPTKIVEVEISDGRKARISFTQMIKPTIDLQMRRAKPKPGTSLLVNHDYTWQLAVNERANMYNEGTHWSDQTLVTPTFNSSINSHATITVQVPESFVLNAAATEAANNRDCPVTVSQAGKGRDVIFMIGHGDENNSDLNEKPYYIVGKFDMAKPNTDQTVNFNASTDQTLLYNLGNLNSTAQWQDTILGNKDASGKPNNDDRPVVQDINGQIYGYQTSGKLPLDHKNTVVLNHITFENENNQDLKNAAITINVPSGLNATSFDIPQIANITKYNYTVTLANGKSKTGTCSLTDKQIAGVTIYKSSDFESAIRKIVISGLDIPVGEGTTSVSPNGHSINVGGIDIYGTVAEKYDNGNPVKLGDKFVSSFSLTAKNLDHDLTKNVTQITDKIPATLGKAMIEYNQSTTGPGQKNAGYIQADYMNYTKDTIFYFVVPENAVYDPQGDQNGITEFKANGHTVIKVTNAAMQFWDTPQLHFNNTTSAFASTKPIVVYLVTGQDESHVVIDQDASEDHFFPKVDSKDLAYVEGNKDAYLISLNTYPPTYPYDHYITKYYWKIMPVIGTGAIEAAKGNENNDGPVQNGKSDDHGNVSMTFHNQIVNTSQNGLTNVVSVSNLPQNDFKFQLNKNGVKVFDEFGHEVNAQILYSLSSADLSQPINLTGFLSGDQVQDKDWSKVKAVAIKFNSLDTNSFVDIVMKGSDPTLPVDAGKKAGLTSRLQANGLGEPFIINEGNSAAATIKVTGQSTVKSRLHYKDDQRHDQYIDLDLKHTYQDNQDEMKKSDFALRDVDKTKIPTGYHLSDADPTIINSNVKEYANKYPNDLAAFGKIAKYYFDGDIVQYELIKDGKKQDQKYTWTVEYHDEQDNKLQNDVIVGQNYKGTDSYDVTTIGKDYQTEITVGDNTYSLVKSKTKNGSGTFGNKDQITILVYKLNPKEQKYNWTVKYQDEQGNELQDDVMVGDKYKGTDSYDVTKIGSDHYKTEITVAGRTYTLLPGKTVNGSGFFNNTNQTTILVYKPKTEDKKYSWTVKYQDVEGNKLQNDVTIGKDYKKGDSYDVTTTGKDYPSTLTTNKGTYEIVTTEIKNAKGIFNDKDQTTILIYKLNPKEQRYSWTVEYHDEQGNKLQNDVIIGTDYKGNDSYDVTKSGSNHYKTEITVTGKTYTLVPKNTVNSSGSFNNSNQTTILVYKPKTEDKKYSWTVKYQDVEGNKLQNDVTIGKDYKKGDSYDVTTTGKDYPSTLTTNKGTYEIVTTETKNAKGIFNDKDQTTILVYKLNPKEQKYSWTVEYHDENGNKLQDDVIVGKDYKGNDSYNVTTIGKKYQTEIAKGQNIYVLVPKDTENGSGQFNNKDQITILVYKLKSKTPPPKGVSTTPSKPENPNSPSTPPVQPQNPTHPVPTPTRPQKSTNQKQPTKPQKNKSGETIVKHPRKTIKKFTTQHKQKIQQKKPTSYEYNKNPHGEKFRRMSRKQNTKMVPPRGQKLFKNRVTQNDVTQSNSKLLNRNGRIPNYSNHSSKEYDDLPITGENQRRMSLMASFGLIIAAIGILFGLSDIRKQRK